MSHKKQNPIAEQSRQWLMLSLLQLMQVKDYSSITVIDIAAHAQLSRRTFYRIFRSKDEVLQHCFAARCEAYTAQLSQHTPTSLLEIIEAFYTFWEQHIDFVLLLQKHHMYYRLLEELNTFLPNVHEIFRGNLHLYENELEKRFALRASAGAMWNILADWAQIENRPSPKLLKEMLARALISNA